jgi:hypothetical protein
MTLRRFSGIALHLLLAVGLVLPGIAAPAQAARRALTLASAEPGVISSHSACDGMSMPGEASTTMPPDARHGCDLAACLGAGCLPAVPHVTAFVPEAESPITSDQPVPPSRMPDTPLRPPIG